MPDIFSNLRIDAVTSGKTRALEGVLFKLEVVLHLAFLLR